MQPNTTLNVFNKSFMTNAVAALIVLLSLLVSRQSYAQCLSNIGFFALSGAVTNWLAIYMLFEKVPFLYGSGVIPNQFHQFKRGIKQLMMDEFFHSTHMKTNPLVTLSQVTIEQFKGQIDYEKLYQMLVQEIQNSSMGAMIAMFGGANALDKLKAPLIEKIKLVLDTLIADLQNSDSVTTQSTMAVFQSTVESMIDERLQELTPGKVKEIIQKMIREHLGWLVVWGGVLGGLIGLLKSLV